MTMKTRAFHKPVGKSVWFGSDLVKSDEWIFELPKHAIEEIDACLMRRKASGNPLEAIGASDVQLGSLDNVCKSIREEVATGRGFVVVRGLPAAKYSLDELSMIYCGVAS